LLQMSYIYDIDNLKNWQKDYNVDEEINNATKEFLIILDDFSKYDVDLTANEGDIIQLGKDIDSAWDEVKGLTESIDFSEIDAIIKSLTDITLPSPELDTIRELFDSTVTELNNLKEKMNNIIYGDEFKRIDDFMTESGGMQVKIIELFASVEEAFNLLEDTEGIIPQFFSSSIDGLLSVVDNYVHFAVDSAIGDIGKTSPLSNIYNATYTDICLEIIDPFNAVWSGLGWCLLLLLIPVTIVIYWLRKIYIAKEQSVLRQYTSPTGKPPLNRAVSYSEVQMAQLGTQQYKYPVPDKYKAHESTSQYKPQPSPSQYKYPVPDKYKAHESTSSYKAQPSPTQYKYPVPDKYKHHG